MSLTRNYWNCTFPRLSFYGCALTRTISLNYRGISLSFHLVTEVFQLVTHYLTFPVRFQLNSDFSHTFLNGQLTRHTINTCIHEHVELESKAQMSCIKGSYLLYVTVPRKRDHFRKFKSVQYSPNTDKKLFLLVFFLLALMYLLPFSYTDTKFEWLKPLLKVRAPRLNTVTFYSLF